VPKLVRVANSVRVSLSMFMILNAFGQVMGWWFLTGKNVAEVKAELQQITERLRLHGWKAIEYHYTDDCCHERRMLHETLSLPLIKGAARGDLPRLYHLGGSSAVKYITSTQGVAGLLDQFDATNGDSTTFGLDLEWVADFLVPEGARRQRPPDVLIISSKTMTIVFHLKLMGSVPTTLQKWLEERSIRKVGVNIKNDATRLARLGVFLRGHEECPRLAKSIGVIRKAQCSLDFLARRFLGGCLDNKDSEDGPRVSDVWAERLHHDALMYAAKDAQVSRRVWIELKRYERELLGSVLSVGDECVIVADNKWEVIASGSLTKAPGIGLWTVDVPYADIRVPSAKPPTGARPATTQPSLERIARSQLVAPTLQHEGRPVVLSVKRRHLRKVRCCCLRRLGAPS